MLPRLFNATRARLTAAGPWACWVLAGVIACGLGHTIGGTARAANPSAGRTAPDDEVEYRNHRDPRGPWSIHVVRVPRKNSQLHLSAVHADGRAVGLSPISHQTAVVASIGTSIAAINGDFYRRHGPFAGEPRGLHIAEGELLSAPSGSVSFWIDALGEPRVTNTSSSLSVTWPGGATTSIGLNGSRRSNGIELYTPALGPTTQTSGGRELILERQEGGPWLPLRPGVTHPARVRAVRATGNTRIDPDTLVLSIGPALARTVPHIEPGAELEISTETTPNLRGVKTAISGGPILLRDGKRQRIRITSDSYESTSMLERHPRSAMGWSEDAYYLVQVDGRHRNSVGMTLNELAALFQELGCSDAMNLDGGGSATLWFQGRVRNRPCDGYERPVANALVVLKKKPAAASTELGASAGGL